MSQEHVKKLGAAIRARRLELGLSARQLAHASAVNVSTIVRLEQGAFAAPSTDTLTHLATALQLDPAELFAISGEGVSKQLPTFRPYLRAKYGELPPEALARLDRYFQRMQREFGASGTGPLDGEDEQPEHLQDS